MTPLVYIDPNVRLSDGRTYAGFEDVVDGPLDMGDAVRVQVPETDLTGTATVTAVNERTRLVTLLVDWSSLRSA